MDNLDATSCNKLIILWASLRKIGSMKKVSSKQTLKTYNYENKDIKWFKKLPTG